MRLYLEFPSFAIYLLFLKALWLPVVAANNVWQNEGEFRWKQLTIPKEGKIGFSIRSPEQTLLQFTNVLDPWASAANRTLENGSGVAIGDFDGDDKADLFFCALQGGSKLFRNLGNWKFEDVTVQSGIQTSNAVCRGAVFADIDGDRKLDLLLSISGQGVRVYKNQGGGRFQDFTSEAGTKTAYGSMTLALADVDGNGALDLYVTNYRTEDIRDRSRIDIMRVNGRVMLAPHLRDRLMLTPDGVLEYGEPDQLYLNKGDGRFAPVSWTQGHFRDETGKPLSGPPLDWGLAASFRDANGDSAPDLYVCNDYWTPDRFWINDGQGKFQAIARVAIRHTSENSMGIDFADVDRDGAVDFLVVDMLSRDLRRQRRQALAQTRMPADIGEIENRPQIMRNTLFHHRGDGTFAEIAELGGITASDWSWQPIFVDLDLDGFEDVLISSGHTRDVQDLDATAAIRALQHPWPRDMDEKVRQETFTREMLEHSRFYPSFASALAIYRNQRNLTFVDMTSAWGTDQTGVHQGMALGDLDGDGDLDLAVNNLNGPAALYRNESNAPRIAVRLNGLPPNTRGIGAKLKLTAPGLPDQTTEIVSGGRYLSGCEAMAVFAASADSAPMTLEVRWRSGRKTVAAGLKSNRLYEFSEANRQTAPDEPSSGKLSSPITSSPLFTDVSHLLSHSHHDDPHDDFLKQPLLPRKLSQEGPGVAWFDVDDNGREDLMIGSGKGGSMAIYLNQSPALHPNPKHPHPDPLPEGEGRNNGGSAQGEARDKARTADGSFELKSSTPLTRDQTSILAVRSNQGAAILSGLANYEDGLAAGAEVRWQSWPALKNEEVIPASKSSVGPLALADFDADGDLDLFAGGRVISGQYPAAADSRLFRDENGRWVLDEPTTKLLERLGLARGAVWSDLNSDGYPELVVGCEWGSIRIFRNQKGALEAWDPPVSSYKEGGGRGEGEGSGLRKELRVGVGVGLGGKLSTLTGMWGGVTTADLDEDGRLDIIAGNWGWNNSWGASRFQPTRLYFGAESAPGRFDVIETHYDPDLNDWAPARNLEVLGPLFPSIAARYRTHHAFSQATIAQVLGDAFPKYRQAVATEFSSMIFFNRGDYFEATPLPLEAQFTPIFALHAADFDGDGHDDLFASQNFYATRPGVVRQDAGRGLLLRGDGKGRLTPMGGQESGLLVYGEQRGAAACDYDADGRLDLAIAQNGAATMLYRNTGAQPMLRVRLAGPPGNPTAVGAQVQLGATIREIRAGAGYWSQDSSIQLFRRPLQDEQLHILWPGGKTQSTTVPAGAREIVIDASGQATLKQ